MKHFKAQEQNLMLKLLITRPARKHCTDSSSSGNSEGKDSFQKDSKHNNSGITQIIKRNNQPKLTPVFPI